METYAPSLVIVLSLFLMVALAYRSFLQGQLSFNGIPVAPRLLANFVTLSCGFLIYLFVILLSYAIITFYWGPLSVVIGPYIGGGPIGKLLGSGNNQGGAILPLIVACSAAWALTWNAEYNPFGVILKFVHDLIRVPDRANTTLQQLRASDFNQLSADAATAIASDAAIEACDPTDFARGHRDLLYRWAHLCHIRFLLLKYLRAGLSSREGHIPRLRRGADIIAALDWEKLNQSYRGLAPRIRDWRASANRDPIDAIEIYSAIAELTEKHYRIMACVIVCVSRNEYEI